MKIVKVREVKTPTRGTERSAGLDFYIPDDFPGSHFLAPGQDVNIPSGIHVQVPKGMALVAMNRTSVALNKHLQVGACVVDEDYQGEIHLHVTNIGMDVQALAPGEKLVQMILIPVEYCAVEVVDTLEELYTEATERGNGAFGSTGDGLSSFIDRAYSREEKINLYDPFRGRVLRFEVTDPFIGNPHDNADKLKEV